MVGAPLAGARIRKTQSPKVPKAQSEINADERRSERMNTDITRIKKSAFIIFLSTFICVK